MYRYPVVAPKIQVEKLRSIYEIDVKSSPDYDKMSAILANRLADCCFRNRYVIYEMIKRNLNVRAVILRRCQVKSLSFRVTKVKWEIRMNVRSNNNKQRVLSPVYNVCRLYEKLTTLENDRTKQTLLKQYCRKKKQSTNNVENNTIIVFN